jgi:hypothetical protein
MTGSVPLWGVEGGSQNAFAVAATSPHADVAARLFEFLSDDYYPRLIEGAVDLTPIPALNADDALYASAEFRELVRLTELATVVLPSPVMRNADQLETIVRLGGKSASRPFGETIQGILADGSDPSAYLAAYAEEQRRFLVEALAEAAAEGADVEAAEWRFGDWNPLANYYGRGGGGGPPPGPPTGWRVRSPHDQGARPTRTPPRDRSTHARPAAVGRVLRAPATRDRRGLHDLPDRHDARLFVLRLARLRAPRPLRRLVELSCRHR